MGVNSAWVAVAGISPTTGVGVGAQVGWLKAPNNPNGPFDPVWFHQYTNIDGDYFPVVWHSTPRFAPTVFTYTVTSEPAGGQSKWYYFYGHNLEFLGQTVVPVSWPPTRHMAFSEVQNFSGDQLPGDPTAHVTYRSMQWSPDSANWFGGSLAYGKGDPSDEGLDRGDLGWDELSWLDGSNFDTWDTRCPT